ncbi:MAG: N-acetylneuraminate synthase [Clostridia bacterium]|nr:N-acetylneuraminate synthase [Clostridia bacterium]
MLFHDQKNFKVSGLSVGDGHPCFIIAEIGSNHNQDLAIAFRCIDAAAAAGANAVKFQTFRAADHYSRRTPSFSYLGGVNTYDLIRSLELDRSWHASLKQHAEARGVVFFSSPCDSDAIENLAALDVAAYKVASFDLTDTDLIFHMASKGKPIIMSTGMANWMDIQYAVDASRKAGNNSLVLLQCTSLYPAPPNLSNLRSMTSMRAAFGTLIGYSDHTMGDHIPLAAVAMGACMLEKHFTLNRRMTGPDHPFATEPSEFETMVKKIREVESAFGDGVKNGPREEELEMAEKGRRSLHARVAIKQGESITQDMLVNKRPGLGVSPALRDALIGRIAARDIEPDEWILWEMVR